MRRAALFNLLFRPLSIGFVALFVPVAIVLLFGMGLKGPAAFIEDSFLVCAVMGTFVGGSIAEASRCSFAWTLPRYRRALLGEFVLCGAVVSGVAGLIATGIGTIPHGGLVAVAVAFAAFSLGGALGLVPESPLLFPIGFVVLFASLSTAHAAAVSAAAASAPVVTIVVALALSALALWLAFGRRTFRWSALTGPRQPGREIWHEWPKVPWWPRHGAWFARRAPQAPSRARYVGSSVLRGVACDSRATKRATWLAGLTVCALLFVVFGPSARYGVPWAGLPDLWMVLMLVALMTAQRSRGSALRIALPWSRRHHFAVAFVSDLWNVLTFLLVTGPALAAAGAIGDPGTLGALVRGIAVTAFFLPAFQWLSGPPIGGRWTAQIVVLVLGFVLLMVYIVTLNLVVSNLPKLMSSSVAQAFALGLLLAGSQALNWRGLKHYFTDCDLTGGAT